MIRETLARFLDTDSFFYRVIRQSPFNRVAWYLHRLVLTIELKILGMAPCKSSRHENESLASQLTFLIKTFERKHEVVRLIKSLHQFYPDVAIVVVDDSREPLQYSGVTIVTLPYDSGVSSGRSRGLEYVHTPYFVSLDDDFIFFRRTTLAPSVQILRDNPQIDIIGGDYINLPFFRRSGPGGFVASREAQGVFPVGTIVGGLKVYDKVPQFYIARTARVATVGWDHRIKRLDHSVFFGRAKGKLVTVFNPDLVVLHARSPFDLEYMKIRNQFDEDRKIIAEYLNANLPMPKQLQSLN